MVGDGEGYPQGAVFHRCWRISICITSLTCGCKRGGGSTPEETWSSCAMPTISFSGSIRTEADRFLENFRKRLGSSDWNYILTKRAGSSSGRLPNSTGNGEGKVSLRRSTFWLHAYQREEPEGYFTVKRHTIRKRLRGSCGNSSNNSGSVGTISWRTRASGVRSVVQGYFNYHAVPGNLELLQTFRYRLIRLWRTHTAPTQPTLPPPRRRLGKLADRWLPVPRVLHPGPCSASPLRIRVKSRMRLISASTDPCGGVPGNRYPYRDSDYVYENTGKVTKCIP